MRHVDQSMCSRRFGNSSELSRVDVLQHSWFNLFLNNVVFSEFGQDRREGNGTAVLVNIINGPLFWDRIAYGNCARSTSGSQKLGVLPKLSLRN